MNGEDKLGSADKLEQELARAAKFNPNVDLQASFDDLKRKLDASRQQITLADLNDQLFSIDDRLAHIQHNTEPGERVDLRLIALEKNTKAMMESAKGFNGNVFAIALMIAFWSAFALWKYYDDIHSFFQALTNHIFHLFS
jgi:hypothetical protein